MSTPRTEARDEYQRRMNLFETASRAMMDAISGIEKSSVASSKTYMKRIESEAHRLSNQSMYVRFRMEDAYKQMKKAAR